MVNPEVPQKNKESSREGVLERICARLRGSEFTVFDPKGGSDSAGKVSILPDAKEIHAAEEGFLWVREGNSSPRKIISGRTIFRSPEGSAILEEILADSSLDEEVKNGIRKSLTK